MVAAAMMLDVDRLGRQTHSGLSDDLSTSFGVTSVLQSPNDDKAKREGQRKGEI